MKANLMIAVVVAGLYSAPAPLFAVTTRTISVNDVTVTEGQLASFLITLSSKSNEKITVTYTTTDETAAIVDGDYFGAKGVLEFKPGEVSKVVTVQTKNDTCHENEEYFGIALFFPTGPVSLGKFGGRCTIIDNDGPTRCCCLILGFCAAQSSCCCGGVGEGVPAEASTPVGVPITYGVLWTVPPPDVWRSLNTMDIRLIGADEEAILTVRWDEAANTFSPLNPGNGDFQPTAFPGSPTRLEGSAVAMLLENSEVIGSGPTGLFVLLNLNLIFKPPAADKPFMRRLASQMMPALKRGTTKSEPLPLSQGNVSGRRREEHESRRDRGLRDRGGSCHPTDATLKPSALASCAWRASVVRKSSLSSVSAPAT